jgi:hypothetical protein
MICLTANDELVVIYKNGFGCYYVGTTRAHYNAMLTWASKGHFVHQFFFPPNYKKGMPTWPYVPVVI